MATVSTLTYPALLLRGPTGHFRFWRYLLLPTLPCSFPAQPGIFDFGVRLTTSFLDLSTPAPSPAPPLPALPLPCPRHFPKAVSDTISCLHPTPPPPLAAAALPCPAQACTCTCRCRVLVFSGLVYYGIWGSYFPGSSTHRGVNSTFAAAGLVGEPSHLPASRPNHSRARLSTFHKWVKQLVCSFLLSTP